MADKDDKKGNRHGQTPEGPDKGKAAEAKGHGDKPAAAPEKPAAAEKPAGSEHPAGSEKKAERPEPAWDRATWMSMANIRLGVPAHVVAGALHAEPAHATLTEADVRRLVKRVTEQSL